MIIQNTVKLDSTTRQHKLTIKDFMEEKKVVVWEECKKTKKNHVRIFQKMVGGRPF